MVFTGLRRALGPLDNMIVPRNSGSGRIRQVVENKSNLCGQSFGFRAHLSKMVQTLSA
jgi:hypothetical protein